MSSSAITSLVFFALALQLMAVKGLRCHCDFCKTSKNNTCETDGFCLSLTWLQRETGTVHHAFRCLDRKAFFPRLYPPQCSLSHVPNVEVRTACCASDMCNLHLKPALMQEPAQDFFVDWDRRPATGTLLENNEARVRSKGYRPPLNFLRVTPFPGRANNVTLLV